MRSMFVYQPESKFEIVERKGAGHPDSLADGLAEDLSRVYSNYTKDSFGAVLHHNFDKVGIMGGKTKLTFGKYKITSPIRVLLNGRASYQFGDKIIPVKEMLFEETKRYLGKRLHGIDVEKDLHIMYEVSSGSSPGSVGEESSLRNRWFAPESLDDLSELKNLNCNDTSLGTAFFHRRLVEECVWTIESELNSDSFRSTNCWIGCDIKIMGCRNDNKLRFTMAIPQLADYVNSVNDYISNKQYLYDYIFSRLNSIAPGYEISLDINTRDHIGNSTDLYLTATGSSVEMGDEGFVGRGNRMGGLITPFRPYTMEGICGKNPVYHTGKMYSIAAWEISKKIYETMGIDANVMLVGQSGQSLSNPWNIILTGNQAVNDLNDIDQVSYQILNDFEMITKKILKGDYTLF